jgi:predicted nicotinamide N-methyase
MTDKLKTEIKAYGIKVLLSRHPAIRRLKKSNIPTSHGNRFWWSSWLLMDYFKKNGLAKGSHVMEIGCGWGLAGIYCAKRHGARVTGIDIDDDVLPFAKLHAEINNTDVTFIKRGFDSMRIKDLRGVDILLGADICFWDSMTDSLIRLIKRAKKAGVKQVLISDPIRSPFEALCEYFTEGRGGEVLDWTANEPREILGQILKVE